MLNNLLKCKKLIGDNYSPKPAKKKRQIQEEDGEIPHNIFLLHEITLSFELKSICPRRLAVGVTAVFRSTPEPVKRFAVVWIIQSNDLHLWTWNCGRGLSGRDDVIEEAKKVQEYRIRFSIHEEN
jgi:hypothetical protein